MSDHAKWLRQAAKEIAAEGHNGWGNTCTDAAAYLERLEKYCEDQCVDTSQHNAIVGQKIKEIERLELTTDEQT